MKPAIKREFLKRLRNSKQCHQALRQNDCYCPEGIIYQMYLEFHQEDVEWVQHGELFSIKWKKENKQSTVLEKAVLEWAGIEESSLSSPAHDIYTVDLHYLNDNTPLSLAEIADLVEEQW